MQIYAHIMYLIGMEMWFNVQRTVVMWWIKVADSGVCV